MRKLLADYIQDFKLITRNVRLFLLGGLLIGILQAFISLLLNLYLKEVGRGEAFIGTVLSMGAFGALVAALPSVYLAARFRLRPIFLIATTLVVTAFVILATTGNEFLLLAASFATGLLLQVKNVVAAPFIMRNSTDRERTLIFSLNFSTWIVSGIVGSFAAGWLHDVYLGICGDSIRSYQYSMLTAAAIGICALIPFSLIRAAAPDPDEVAKVFAWKSLWAKKSLFARLTFPSMLIGAGAGLIIPFLNLYFKNRFDLGAKQIGFYFSMLQFAMLAAVLIVPILKKRIGYIHSIVLAELLSIPFMLILCYTQNLTMAFWAFLFRGALMNMGVPVSTTFMMESVEQTDHGLINSLSSIAWSSVWMISTQTGGVMIQNSGFVGVFQLAIVLYLASASLYYYFFSRCERREGGKIMVDISQMR